MLRRRNLAVMLALGLAGGCAGHPPAATTTLYSGPPIKPSVTDAWPIHHRPHPRATVAFRWVDVIQETSARRVTRTIAKPTIIARDMMICCTAMFDAWAAYDDKAVCTRLGDTLRRPAPERTLKNKEIAIGYAITRCLEDLYPEDKAWIRETVKTMGVDASKTSTDPSTPIGVGNRVAAALLEYAHKDGANQLGDMKGGSGEPYSDTTGYKPKRAPGEEQDPDRWMPISFAKPDGSGRFTPPGLTPHWGRVRTVGLESSDQFRTPGPPKAASEQMRREVDECIEANATLSVRQKAIVEFMRDGPGSTGQSGHWLKFAADVSRRDNHTLDQDVKLFFSVAAVVHDAFVHCWADKYHYDSSRPYWYVRYFYKGRKVKGYAGPCQGFKLIDAEEWHPYSPDTFVTPPFPGYPSGHATASGAAAKILELFTGSDRFEFVAKRSAGELTGEGKHDCTVYEMQRIDGRIPRDVPQTRDVDLPLPTFSETARMAAESRLLGGYHIRADNDDGLALGKRIAEYAWTRYRTYWEGTAKVRD